MKQNIYDNDEFFYSYKALRETDNNCNVLLEQPAMRELLPDLKGKTALDLGCGFGDNCMDFVKMGANKVVGIDISKNMLGIAKSKNSNEKIEYINLPLEDLSKVQGKFDLVYSSLCFHYIKDFDVLIENIYDKLNSGGMLLFSQEHPVVTASAGVAGYYNVDENGNKVYCFCNYQDETEKRVEKWFVDGVIKYHRTFATIINTLVEKGFVIERVVEPIPSAEAIAKRPGLEKAFIKPNYLIIKSRKQ